VRNLGDVQRANPLSPVIRGEDEVRECNVPLAFGLERQKINKTLDFTIIMKSIKELKNPDIITINDEKFQVIENTSVWYHTDKDELEMGVGLVKVGEKSMTPTHRLHYIYEKPDEVKSWKFFSYNKNTKEMEEINLDSHKF
jgi:hypothetical protein